MDLWWSWLVVGLLCGPGFSNELGRHRRQSDARWRSYQPGRGSSRGLVQLSPRVGSPRGNSLPQSVSGFGSLRGSQPVPGWGSRYTGGFQPRQFIQPVQSPSSPISLQCAEDSMVVTVNRNFYGNGKLVKPSDLTLGTCQLTAVEPSRVVFENGLHDCGSTLAMTPDWLVYLIYLHYNPTSPSNVPITRFNPAVVPIQCYYPRHGNVSSNPIKPTWVPYFTTVTSEERLSFSLRLMTADWSAPSSSMVFQLGDIIYIEATLDIQNHDPMMLFVDTCKATITPDMTSTPSYDIISNNGCLMDGIQEDSSSAFEMPRPQPNILRFKVDAFIFTDSSTPLIFITCSLRAAAINQTPDPMNKACSYNKATGSWSPVEGPSGICQCCSTGNCAAGPGIPRVPPAGRPRGFGKRDVGSQEETHGQAMVGPILLTGAKPNQISRGTTQASRMSAGRESLQLWVLVAIGSVSAVIVVVGLAMVVKCLWKRFSHKVSVSQ
ncbi:zona pellucida sperm-binding protein 3-like [Leptodactylus fuscus]|uniref:zona pellucida sperm-binding protein 3-like n=1 Tax=Leptodactylus fuscus TaxID=238119 RepID=UPI003F4E991F